MPRRIIVFAPHPDDETLGCGGTIAKRLREGYDVLIVFMTDGRNALSKLFNICSNPTPLKLREIRKEEAKKAAKVLGVKEEKLIFLDIEDGSLEKKGIAQEKLLKILKENSPEEVYFPQAKEANRDHIVTNTIVKDSISELKIHPIEYQYVIAWSIPFCILSHVKRHLPFWLISSFSKMKLVSIDVSDFLSQKKSAIDQYRSQIEIVSTNQKKPVVSSCEVDYFLRKEEKFFVIH